MSDMTKRNKANKRKGSAYEIDLVDFVRVEMELDAERLPRTGRNDQGDLVIRLTPDLHLIIEAKNTQKIDLAGFLAEATVEAGNYGNARNLDTYGAVAVKRRNHSTASSYLVMEFHEFIALLLRVSTGGPLDRPHEARMDTPHPQERLADREMRSARRPEAVVPGEQPDRGRRMHVVRVPRNTRRPRQAPGGGDVA